MWDGAAGGFAYLILREDFATKFSAECVLHCHSLLRSVDVAANPFQATNVEGVLGAEASKNRLLSLEVG